MALAGKGRIWIELIEGFAPWLRPLNGKLQKLIMKTTLCVLSAGLAALCVRAQDEAYYEPAPSPPIVYQSTVTYQVPVVYQAPVIYQAPVSFQGPVTYEGTVAAPYPTTPNVIYVGGPGSCGPNFYTYPRYSSPNVIFFGQWEAYQRGYHFRHRR